MLSVVTSSRCRKHHAPMRKSVHAQLPLVPQIAGHTHMEELAEMSRILDAHPQAAEPVLADLPPTVSPRGLPGTHRLARKWRKSRWRE